MIETDEQRRWWFATHPEFSWSKRGTKSRERKKEEDGPNRFTPEDVDAYVDERLKYATGSDVHLLNAIKETLGSEAGSSTLDYRLSGWDQPASQSAGGEPSHDEDGDRSDLTPWEQFLKSIDQGLRPWGLGAPGESLFPALRLAKNLERVYGPRPDGHVAHHIVAANDRRAAKARDLLEKKFKIGIHDAENGVWLRATKVGEGAYHPGLNTNVYHETVTWMLEQATSKKEAVAVLQKMGEMLSKGTFPY